MREWPVVRVPVRVSTTTTSNPARLRSAARVNVSENASFSVGYVAKVSPSYETDHRSSLVRVTTKRSMLVAFCL